MRVIFTFLIFLITNGFYAQSYWKSYTVDDGLIDNNVKDIASSDSKVYLATENGLSVFENEDIRSIRQYNDTVFMITDEGLSIYYDGIFENYSDTNGLISNQITDIEVDSKGELWIASLDGLVRKQGDSFIHDSTRKVYELGINAGDSVYAVVNFHTLINVANPVTIEI